MLYSLRLLQEKLQNCWYGVTAVTILIVIVGRMKVVEDIKERSMHDAFKDWLNNMRWRFLAYVVQLLGCSVETGL